MEKANALHEKARLQFFLQSWSAMSVRRHGHSIQQFPCNNSMSARAGRTQKAPPPKRRGRGNEGFSVPPGMNDAPSPRVPKLGVKSGKDQSRSSEQFPDASAVRCASTLFARASYSAARSCSALIDCASLILSAMARKRIARFRRSSGLIVALRPIFGDFPER